MWKRMLYAAAAALLLTLCLCCGALAEQGKDITKRCAVKVSAYDKKNLLDDRNMTMWYQPEKNAWIEVRTPEGTAAGGVYIRWGLPPLDIQIDVQDQATGEWQPVMKIPAGYYNQYISLETPLTRFRIRPQEKQAEFLGCRFHFIIESEDQCRNGFHDIVENLPAIHLHALTAPLAQPFQLRQWWVISRRSPSPKKKTV